MYAFVRTFANNISKIIQIIQTFFSSASLGEVTPLIHITFRRPIAFPLKERRDSLTALADILLLIFS